MSDEDAAAYDYAFEFGRDQEEAYAQSLSNEAEALAHMGYSESDESLPFDEPLECDE